MVFSLIKTVLLVTSRWCLVVEVYLLDVAQGESAVEYFRSKKSLSTGALLIRENTKIFVYFVKVSAAKQLV